MKANPSLENTLSGNNSTEKIIVLITHIFALLLWTVYEVTYKLGFVLQNILIKKCLGFRVLFALPISQGTQPWVFIPLGFSEFTKSYPSLSLIRYWESRVVYEVSNKDLGPVCTWLTNFLWLYQRQTKYSQTTNVNHNEIEHLLFAWKHLFTVLTFNLFRLEGKMLPRLSDLNFENRDHLVDIEMNRWKFTKLSVLRFGRKIAGVLYTEGLMGSADRNVQIFIG